MTTSNEITNRENERSAAAQASAGRARRVTVAPPVDIYENDEEILLVADLPGVKTEDVKIRLDRGELTLEARRSDETTGRPLALSYQPHDNFRRFLVPGGIDGSRIDAQLKNGVLFLHLPKAEEAKPRQIPVRSR